MSTEQEKEQEKKIAELHERAIRLSHALEFNRHRAAELAKVGEVLGGRLAANGSILDTVRNEVEYSKHLSHIYREQCRELSEVRHERDRLARQVDEQEKIIYSYQAQITARTNDVDETSARLSRQVDELTARLASAQNERDQARMDLAALENTIGRRLGDFGKVETRWPQLGGCDIIAAKTSAIDAVMRCGDQLDALTQLIGKPIDGADKADPIGRAAMLIQNMLKQAFRDAAADPARFIVIRDAGA